VQVLAAAHNLNFGELVRSAVLSGYCCIIMAPRLAVAVVALAMLLLLCGPELVSCLIQCAVDPLLQPCRNHHASSAIALVHTQVASRSLLEDCGKCNLPVDKGGCKCDANCACLPGKGRDELKLTQGLFSAGGVAWGILAPEHGPRGWGIFGLLQSLENALKTWHYGALGGGGA
jgi:hypothetical protein